MEKELQEENSFNQMDTIDMDIDIDMDEDDFGDFGGKEQAKILKPQVPQSNQVMDKNSAPTVISADVDDFGNLQIKNNKHNMTGIEMVDNEPQHFSGYNQIDMDMDYDPDLDDDFSIKPVNTFDDFDDESEDRPVRKSVGVFADFNDDDEYEFVNGEPVLKNSAPAKTIVSLFEEDEIEPELVSEELLDERKGDMIDQADIEDDYLARLAKRHAKTNKKGSYNTHFRMGGDPEKEREILNHDLTPVGNPVHGIATATVDGGGEAIGVSAGVSGGCGEAVKSINKNKLFENLLFITGFDLKPNCNGKLILTDLTDMVPEIECGDEKEALLQLKPYINDAIIIPLQYTTKENFNEPQEWVNWYTPDMEKRFPRCKGDIQYCQMLVDLTKKS